MCIRDRYIPFDVRRELDGAHHCIHADSYRGNYFFSFYNEDDEEQSAKIFEYAIKDDRLTPVAEYNLSLIHISHSTLTQQQPSGRKVIQRMPFAASSPAR